MSSIKLKNVSKWFGKNLVIKNVNLEIKDGEFVVLVGPSGCGKSTLLRIISGLEDLEEGKILINSEDVTSKIPSERELSMVFQSYALYPHMNVYDNIGFSLKMSGMNKDLLKEKITEVARILKLESLLNRLPKQLSGGQRQRVAIGRAIIRQPKAFLFDEPLSNLDASLRVEMRLEISRLHKKLGVTTIYVTHDQVEAMTLADKIVVMKHGEIVQVGSPRQLFNKPKNLFVAEFIGTPKINVLGCISKSGFIYINGKDKNKTNIKKMDPKIDKIAFRPDKVSICEKNKGLLTGEIKFVEYLGSEQFIYVDCGINEKLIVVKTDPNYSIPHKKIIGLKILSKDLYFFQRGNDII